uniref:SDR family NAD(P)-dependent oxidoreductase n=2 Tax=Mycobacteriaceae TaxID=1762 RepID=UPI0021F26A9E
MTALLDGKSAIVTGAGSGVGRASALRFADEGARVLVADIDLDNAKETVRQIEGRGGAAVAVEVDVADEAAVEGMIAA